MMGIVPRRLSQGLFLSLHSTVSVRADGVKQLPHCIGVALTQRPDDTTTQRHIDPTTRRPDDTSTQGRTMKIIHRGIAPTEVEFRSDDTAVEKVHGRQGEEATFHWKCPVCNDSNHILVTASVEDIKKRTDSYNHHDRYMDWYER
jgi:hypothetical protein